MFLLEPNSILLANTFHNAISTITAGMAELVDASVSKTDSHKDCRFDSDYPHH
jgi:hypothetical protein